MASTSAPPVPTGKPRRGLGEDWLLDSSGWDHPRPAVLVHADHVGRRAGVKAKAFRGMRRAVPRVRLRPAVQDGSYEGRDHPAAGIERAGRPVAPPAVVPGPGDASCTRSPDLSRSPPSSSAAVRVSRVPAARRSPAGREVGTVEALSHAGDMSQPDDRSPGRTVTGSNGRTRTSGGPAGRDKPFVRQCGGVRGVNARHPAPVPDVR